MEMAPGEDEAPEELEGVGERAFYTSLIGHNIVLVAGGRFASLIVRENTEDDSREQAIELARKVAERL